MNRLIGLILRLVTRALAPRGASDPATRHKLGLLMRLIRQITGR